MSYRRLISIIIGCRNVESYIDEALFSARFQTVDDLEIIVVNDGSTDATPDRIHAHASEDQRITVLNGPGRGPAAARNLALSHAKGEWIAILDGDDIMHPHRLEWMLSYAGAGGADIVTDNLFAFHDSPLDRRSYLLVDDEKWRPGRPIDLESFIRSNIMFSKAPALGYLKPLIRQSCLNSLRYDESLRIGEDYDLLVRLLAQGADFRFIWAPLYFYRRHVTSTSYRLRSDDLASLVVAADRFHSEIPVANIGARAASIERRDTLKTALAFSKTVDALHARSPLAALGTLARHPAALGLLAKAASEGIAKRLRPAGATVTNDVGNAGHPVFLRTHLGETGQRAGQLAETLFPGTVSLAGSLALFGGETPDFSTWPTEALLKLADSAGSISVTFCDTPTALEASPYILASTTPAVLLAVNEAALVTAASVPPDIVIAPSALITRAISLYPSAEVIAWETAEATPRETRERIMALHKRSRSTPSHRVEDARV